MAMSLHNSFQRAACRPDTRLDGQTAQIVLASLSVAFHRLLINLTLPANQIPLAASMPKMRTRHVTRSPISKCNIALGQPPSFT